MKVLICGDLYYELKQEFAINSNYFADVIVLQTSIDEIKSMTIEKINGVSILFLSPELDDIISFAKWMNRVNPVCQLIFIGNSYTMLPKIYETKHAFFMVREKVHSEFHQAMRCAIHNYKAELDTKRISVYCGGIKCFILIEDIIFAEVLGRTLFIHTVQGNIYKTNCSLKKFSEKLPSWFVRTHNSYIVNKRQVSVLEYPECILRNGERIPVSSHYRQEVCRKLSVQNVIYDNRMTSYDINM